MFLTSKVKAVLGLSWDAECEMHLVLPNWL